MQTGCDKRTGEIGRYTLFQPRTKLDGCAGEPGEGCQSEIAARSSFEAL
jgi:hypothetical protein